MPPSCGCVLVIHEELLPRVLVGDVSKTAVAEQTNKLHSSLNWCTYLVIPQVLVEQQTAVRNMRKSAVIPTCILYRDFFLWNHGITHL